MVEVAGAVVEEVEGVVAVLEEEGVDQASPTLRRRTEATRPTSGQKCRWSSEHRSNLSETRRTNVDQAR